MSKISFMFGTLQNKQFHSLLNCFYWAGKIAQISLSPHSSLNSLKLEHLFSSSLCFLFSFFPQQHQKDNRGRVSPWHTPQCGAAALAPPLQGTRVWEPRTTAAWTLCLQNRNRDYLHKCYSINKQTNFGNVFEVQRFNIGLEPKLDCIHIDRSIDILFIPMWEIQVSRPCFTIDNEIRRHIAILLLSLMFLKQSIGL